MKVIYDVSLFGCVPLWPHTRSGLFRVAENLALALLDAKKCSLTFSAAVDFLHYHAAYQARQTPRLAGVPFFYSPAHYALSAKYYEVNQRIPQTSGLARIGWRTRRKILHHVKALFDSRRFSPKSLLDDASFKQADIFHSPYYAIPAEVRKYGRLQKFLTVHDLIPVLYPKYFDAPPPGQQHHLKEIIDGIRPADWITCVSGNTKKDLCNYRPDLDPGKVFVTHLGAADCFYPCADREKIAGVRAKYKIPAGKYILSVGTLEPRKNVPHLIRSFLKLIQQERLKDLSLVLVGSLGWKYEAILSELTAAAGDLRGRVVLTGRVEDADLAALYSGATVFVYPSLYEGFGLPPLEAMQCGVPVITSNTSSLPEVVGNAALMVDPENADELCQAMLEVVTRDELNKTLAKKSLERSSQFGWKQCAAQTIAAYQTACDSI